MRARILVAEDHQINWRLTELLLSRRGHRADHAKDGRQALAMLERGGYELVFMDCRMPGLDGYQTTREIRRREASDPRRRAAIVAMTANASEEDRRRCLAAGMDDYIGKPISFEVLDEALERWLSPERRDVPALDEAILNKLVAEVNGEVEQIDLAGPQADPGGVAHTAHRIQNSARLIGASRLADAAAQVEARAVRERGTRWRPTGSERRRLAHEWELTRAAIEQQAFAVAAAGERQ
jgi:CheY-like chemotaxis protein